MHADTIRGRKNMAMNEFVHQLATQGQNFAALATTMPDGTPQVSLVWIDSDGENLIINTAEGRIKTNNIRRLGVAALAIADSENHYRQAMIRGKVVEETHEGADEHINKMSMKYLNLDEYPHRQPGEQRVIIKIKPEKVFILE